MADTNALIGFTIDLQVTTLTICNALKLFFNEILHSHYDDYCRADDQLHTVKLVPTTSLPDVFELSYYSSAVMPIFATESVLGKKTSPFVFQSIDQNF